jgi:phosphoribosylformylglycinamidine synthase
MDLESRVVTILLQAIRNGWVKMAHDLSEGGLAIALAETYLSAQPEYNLTVSLPDELELCTTLYNETAGRILVAVPSEHESALQQLAQSHAVPCQRIASYSPASPQTPAHLKIHHRNKILNFSKQALHLAYESTLPSLLD